MNKQIVLEQGTVIYQELGDGYPLVFLHGALSNANTWRQVIQPLSRYFRCIIPTLPLGGHTIPIHATTPIRSHHIAEMLKQFTDHLNLKQFALLGNDTGGAYAQVFTSLYPDRVSHLILSNCDGLEVFPPKLFQTLPLAVKIPGFMELMGLAMRSAMLAKSKLILGALSTTLEAKTIHELYLRSFMDNADIRRDFKMLVLGWDNQDTLKAAHLLKNFQQPVLILWGLADKDLFPLSLGQRIAAIFPNARLQTVALASTYVQEDQPEAFIRHVQAFMEETHAPIVLQTL